MAQIKLPVKQVFDSLDYLAEQGLEYKDNGIDLRPWLSKAFTSGVPDEWESADDQSKVALVKELLKTHETGGCLEVPYEAETQLVSVIRLSVNTPGWGDNAVARQMCKTAIIQCTRTGVQRAVLTIWVDNMATKHLISLLFVIAPYTLLVGAPFGAIFVNSNQQYTSKASVESIANRLMQADVRLVEPLDNITEADDYNIVWRLQPVLEASVYGTQRYEGDATLYYHETSLARAIDLCDAWDDGNSDEGVFEILDGLGIDDRGDTQVTYTDNVSESVDYEDVAEEALQIHVYGQNVTTGASESDCVQCSELVDAVARIRTNIGS